MAESQHQPTLAQVGKPISLVPVGLKEAALDSPTFRATTIHFSEQVDIVEKWLDSYVKSIIKLSSEVSTLESLVNGFLAHTVPPAHLSEAVMDHDYTLLAMKRYGEGAKDFWSLTISALKRMDSTMVEPIRTFFQNDLRGFKDARRQLEQSQRQFDNLQFRYSAQSKAKEASSLREDAFQLHEARKSYLKASMDFSIVAPQLRMSLDKMLVAIFFDQWRDMRTCRESMGGPFSKIGSDLDRIRGWSREMESGEKTFRRELQLARKQIEENAELAIRPSRELEDYTMPLASALAAKNGPLSAKLKPIRSEKQGWLNLRTITGKPARTLWVRRWFFVKNGIFGWLVQGSRSGGVEESERIGVLLCGVRSAPQEERRFCFEVKTKDTTIVLQAETQPELMDWMSTFDVAKQKALEDPSSTDSPTSGSPRTQDPAFAISPPSAPEFAASAADAGMQQSSEDHTNTGVDRVATLPIPGGESGSNLATRSSFDVTTNRRSSAFERDGESSRDHANRIIQKLDLHRKSTSGPQIAANSPVVSSFSTPQVSGGIASLISASHNALPGVSLQAPMVDIQVTRAATISSVRDLPTSTLAPSTLANPPTPTNLSAAAVIVNGERGIGMGRADLTGGTPSGIMANLWGSSNWGHMNRLERGEIKPSQDINRSSNPPSPYLQASESPSRSARTFSGDHERLNSIGDRGNASVGSLGMSPRHRNTVSLDGDAASLQRRSVVAQEFPNYYPVQLKTQDAQFRLLFPNVRREEKVVLVFRATWNPNDQQEFPGRVYVTANDIYFYSHHLGLVLITGVSLRSIMEVTAAPGRDCDFLFLHLGETSDKTDFTRITIKTFLEPLKLLQRRLNFLVQNSHTEDPSDLESIMRALIKVEQEESTRSSSPESWEDGALNASTEGSSALRHNASQKAGRDLRATVLVDQGLYGDSKRLDEAKELTKFKLPAQPVVYVPRGMAKVAVEKEFDISPKALFHVMFGDRSVVWQLLYLERQAQRIQQGPWTRQEQSHMRRTFEYHIEYMDMLRRNRHAAVIDYQMIDVLNDHLCYVVTDRKTPWHLPYLGHFMLVSKIVITHVAKSRCKLAIYVKVDWSRMPPVVKDIIEARGLADLELDALDLADVITDQVRRLGAQSRTKKAIQIFGPIGQQTQATEFTASDSPLASQVRRMVQSRTMTHLVLEALGSLLGNFFTSLMMWCLTLLRWTWKTGNANSIILILLGVSVLTNVFFSSKGTSDWWKERSAGNFMNRLGVGPELMMSKAVHIRDIDAATWMDPSIAADFTNPCVQTFDILNSLEGPPNSASAAVRRFRHSREHLGSYRHDLVVAMRVVNRIEREMMRAEWESWIRGETGRCTQMEGLLTENVTEESSSGIQRIAHGNDSAYIRGRFENYCQSCRAAQEQTLDGFASSST